VGLVALQDAEGVLFFEEEPVRVPDLLVPAFRAVGRQLFEDGFVDGERGTIGEKYLVGARECAIEPHKTKIILVAACRMLPGTGGEETRGVTLSEDEGQGSQVERDRLSDPSENPEGAKQVKLLAGRICAIVGILFAIGGLVGPILAGGSSVSAGVVGMILGILAYFLGARRIGTITVVLSVASLFFGLAASQDLIPGIEGSDRGLPAIEPNAGDN